MKNRCKINYKDKWLIIDENSDSKFTFKEWRDSVNLFGHNGSSPRGIENQSFQKILNIITVISGLCKRSQTVVRPWAKNRVFGKKIFLVPIINKNKHITN
jgi:hypothetical protein